MPNENPPRRRIIVDGSNIATEGRTLPSLAQLDEAIRAFLEEYRGFTTADVTVVVDASFAHRIDPSEVAAFEEAVLHGEMVTPPAGAVGRGDGFILRIAEKSGALVLSNDSFQEFHAERPWLFDDGRLIGGKPVPGVGWVFTPRIPVRGPKSRAVTGKSRRDARSSSNGSGRSADGAADEIMGDGIADGPDDGGSPESGAGKASKATKASKAAKAGRTAKAPKSAKPVKSAKSSKSDQGDGADGADATDSPDGSAKTTKATKAAKSGKAAKAARATKAAKDAGPEGTGGGNGGGNGAAMPTKAAKSTKAAKATKATKAAKAARSTGASPSEASTVPAATGGRSNGAAAGGGAPGRPGLAALNEPLPFITFVSDHPVGATLEGTVVSFTSHGAHVDVGTMRCHVPLRGLADPPAVKARDVLTKGETREFVLVSLDAARRRAELALPGLHRPS